MNFTEVVAAILALVKRPDKLNDIRREVNAAINFFSKDINAVRDVVELQHAIVATEYTQAILLSAFPRFRKFQYLKRAGTLEYLKPLDSRKMLTASCDRADRWYIAGSSVNISMTKLATHLDVGYYQYPPILTDASPDYWMLSECWPVIFDRAIAKIYATIDADSEARRHEGYAVAGWLSARADIEKGSGQ